MSKAKAIIDIAKMGFPYQTLDPFLFCVYHIDHFPAGDEKMRAPRRGNGADFDWSQPYRMYHGNEYSGFPQHPHRGFETITATVDGIIDHTDSLGNAGRYGKGDLQWMTAGKGIVHGENFPFINQAPKDNFSKFFQIWLNLPKKSKMVDPTFVMIWAEDVEKVKTETSEITVWAGELGDAKGKAPPPNSWAADPANKVWVFRIVLEPKGTFEIPIVDDVDVNRRVYLYEGSGLSANDKEIPSKHYATLDAKEKVTLTNNGDEQVEVLLLQGKPIAEPVVQHGPFVMNTRAEIQQAFLDYQATQFGGWPWPQDAMIFPREKGRFALLYGKETTPPVNVDDDNDN